jgi:hypothetical protein
MTNTFTWIIKAMDAYPQEAGQTNVVFTVHWILIGTDGNGHSGSVYGTIGLTYNSGDPFTPYSQLTQEQVINWVVNTLGSDEISKLETSINQQIATQINPPFVSPPLPWISNLLT